MDATFVLFVDKKRRALIRGRLTPALVGEVNLRERKTLSGSEFYFSGPATLARQAHATAATLLRSDDLAL